MTERPNLRSTLLRSLGRVAKAHPLSRKILVSSTFGEGSELLRALAFHEGGWAGFEVTTPGRLAARIAGAELASAGLATLDQFGQRALVDRAMDSAFATDRWSELGVLEHGVGTDPEFPIRQASYRRQVELYAQCWTQLTEAPIKERIILYTAQLREETWWVADRSPVTRSADALPGPVD